MTKVKPTSLSCSLHSTIEVCRWVVERASTSALQTEAVHGETISTAAAGVETAIADPSPAGASLREQGMCRDITKTKKFACL